MTSLFLTAEWRHIVMINYSIDPEVLLPFVPKGTELDLWKGNAYISLVGFRFLNTRILGWRIPFHSNFEEVNLRFYVKRGQDRGVVFIKEIVPRKSIAYLARRLYNENYVAMQMMHQIIEKPLEVGYQWKFNGEWQKMQVRSSGGLHQIAEGSEEEFITEHYWGYSPQFAYQVEHPKWRMWKVDRAEIAIDAAGLYGSCFAPWLAKAPASCFALEGSPVKVFFKEEL